MNMDRIFFFMSLLITATTGALMGLNIGKDINIGSGLKMILGHFKALEQSRNYHALVPTRKCVN